MTKPIPLELTREELELLDKLRTEVDGLTLDDEMRRWLSMGEKARAALQSHEAESWEREIGTPWKAIINRCGMSYVSVRDTTGEDACNMVARLRDKTLAPQQARLMAEAPELAKALARHVEVCACEEPCSCEAEAEHYARSVLRAAGYPGYTDREGE